VRWIEHVCQPVTGPDGTPLGFRVSNRDISTRRDAEDEASRLRDELVHISRATTLGQVAASLAHEINQPLAAILSNAQAARRFLAADVPDLTEVQGALSDIIEDDRRAGQVIDRLRSLLRRGEVERGILDVNEMIREVSRLVQSSALVRGAAVRLALAEALAPVLGDRIQLQQVVLNLAQNSLEAMEGAPAESRKLTVRTSTDGAGTVKVSVVDTGPPLDEQALDRMFEPFHTTKEAGLGVGLPISRSIIEAHGGQIWATCNDGRGLTVHFTLPCAGGGSDT
jgi:C4-dicarboxylate-specific signal transduction histidine kinase